MTELNTNSRHPFRVRASAANESTFVRKPIRPLRLQPCQQSNRHATPRVDVCLVQGSQCVRSAPVTLALLARHLQEELRLSVRVLIADPLSRSQCLHDALQDLPWSIFYSAQDLKRLLKSHNARCTLLSSHDVQFEACRRGSATIRWMHEAPRCYDPQASRCFTPLFVCSAVVADHLSGYVGEARPFRNWKSSIAEDLVCQYTAGPIRVVSYGDIGNPRSNFKGYQALAEKFPTQQFIWYGATRSKDWKNISFVTFATSWTEVLMNADFVIWCADDDMCPIPIFQALYLGVRVLLFEKNLRYGLDPLRSMIDGSPLLDVSSMAPQHAALHLLGKNPKHPEDLIRARFYVDNTVGSPPLELVRAIQSIVEAEDSSGIETQGSAANSS